MLELLKLLLVLILVLMEDTLRERKLSQHQACCRLNPCFNGRYSQRIRIFKHKAMVAVLILVLMEDTLRGSRPQAWLTLTDVLILVLMEDTLRDPLLAGSFVNTTGGLNPCFNGRYSQSGTAYGTNRQLCVLILVLMEDTLRVCLDFSINELSNGS